MGRMETPLPSTVVFLLSCLGEFLFGNVYGSDIFETDSDDRGEKPFFSFYENSEWGPLKKTAEPTNTFPDLDSIPKDTRDFLRHGSIPGKLKSQTGFRNIQSQEYFILSRSFGTTDFEKDNYLCYADVNRFDVYQANGEFLSVPAIDQDANKARVYFLCDGHCCGKDCCNLNLMFFLLIGAAIGIVFLTVLAVLFVKKTLWARLRAKRKRDFSAVAKEEGGEGTDDNDNDPYQKEWVSVFSPRFQVDSDSKMEIKAPPPPGRATRVLGEPRI